MGEGGVRGGCGASIMLEKRPEPTSKMPIEKEGQNMVCSLYQVHDRSPGLDHAIVRWCTQQSVEKIIVRVGKRGEKITNLQPWGRKSVMLKQ